MSYFRDLLVFIWLLTKCSHSWAQRILILCSQNIAKSISLGFWCFFFFDTDGKLLQINKAMNHENHTAEKSIFKKALVYIL